MSDTLDLPSELARKANVARAVADGLLEGDTTDAVTYGQANILEQLGDDLDHLASRVQTELADSPQ